MPKTTAPTPPPVGAGSKYSTEVLELIDKYRVQDPKAATAPEDKTPEPAFVPEPTTIGDGYKAFEHVFGWVPTSTDVPIRVFKPEDWDPMIRPFIPTALPNGDLWIWPREETEALALAFACGDRTLLHGPTGAGKSALVEAFAFVTRTPLIRVNCHREQQSTDFLGKDILKASPSGATVLEYDWSLASRAAKLGGILLLDEAFRSPALMSIQSLLERNGTLTLPDAASLTPEQRHIVPDHSRFWIALTDNTNGTGDDTGAYNAEVQDLSTLDRITSTIFVDYMNKADEALILEAGFPKVPKKIRERLIRWAGAVRDAFKRTAIAQPISMRAMHSILRKFERTGKLKEAITLAYMAKLSAADKTVCAEAWHQVNGDNMLSE